ncbi:MAG: hypothetical protein Kow0069_30530 [Promethearchaeota archaeon]
MPQRVTKTLVFLGFYSLLHFLYELVPVLPVALIAGTNESVFTHMKLAFYAYLFTSIIFLNSDNNGTTPQVAAFTSSLVPLFLLAVWYLVPLFVGEIHPLGVELAYSFVVLAVNSFMVGSIEQQLKGAELQRGLKYAAAFLFVCSIIFYTGFTFTSPFIDLFEIP